MDKNFNYFISKFYEIKNMGYVNGIVCGSSAVGRTFEHLLGIKGNCDVFPDLHGVEIKTKVSKRYGEISLFNCTPIGDSEYEIERLRNRYGYPNKEYREYKVLYASTNCLDKSKVGVFYKFKLKLDKKRRKIVLLIYNLKDKLIDDTTFWPLDLIESRFMGKCSTLAFISAEKSYKYGNRAFWYKDMKLMNAKSFETFVNLFEKGLIRIDFKIGISKNPDTLGRIYDHGTAFKIDEKNLEMLFTVIYDSNNQSSITLGDQGV